MIPRIFVSSTYYDLKHVRERLEKFIDNYGFEPILFESDNVTYQHGKEIDHSAYYEVGLCHLMILIVGGRYGASSTPDKVIEERKKYDDDYISITRKEFETAIFKNIPVLIFIDKNVYGEYQTYKKNQDLIDELNLAKLRTKDVQKFTFANVDHVNVFKFIDVLRSNPIKTFERVEEIENYIKAQLSGMFYLYLESLKKNSDDNVILDTIAQLNNVTLRMNEMLSSIGREILRKDEKEYEKVIESQLEIMMGFFVDQFNSTIEFENTLTDAKSKSIDYYMVSKIIYEDTLKVEIPLVLNNSTWAENNKFIKDNQNKILSEVQLKLANICNNLIIKKYNFRKLNIDFKVKVLPFIKNDHDEDLLIKRIQSVITNKLDDVLPF